MNGNNFALIRLMAALLVFHTHGCYVTCQGGVFWDLKWMRLGRLAVCAFFVMSGYLVYQSWFRKPDLKDFFLRRLKRILPALWVSVLFCVCLIGPLFTTMALKDYWSHPGTWKFFRNFLCLCPPGGSFNGLPGVFESHTWLDANVSLWTLPYEMLFYLVIGFFGVAGVFRHAYGIYLGVVFWILAACLLLKGNFLTDDLKSHAEFFSMLLLGSFFWMGALYAHVHRLYPKFLEKFLCVEGLAITIFCWHLCTYNVVLYQLATFLLLPYMVLSFGLAPSLLQRCSLGFLEKNNFSFGIYLYGFPIQQGVYALKWCQGNFLAYNGVCLGITLILAVFSWYGIEKPLLKWKKSVRQLPLESSSVV
jgi:peptidoglycan/LPS O-acetylase OafA/YrhL